MPAPVVMQPGYVVPFTIHNSHEFRRRSKLEDWSLGALQGPRGVYDGVSLVIDSPGVPRNLVTHVDVLPGVLVLHGATRGNMGFNLDGAFSDMSALYSITLPEGLTTIGANVFRCCKSLTVVNLPSTVTVIASCAFRLCVSLVHVTIPDGVEELGEWCFAECTRLKSVKFPTSLKVVGPFAFGNCTRLVAVQLPRGANAIRRFAFHNCPSLKVVRVPYGLATINERAFYRCTSLSCMNLPSTVTHLGPDVFGQTELERLSGTVPNSYPGSFVGGMVGERRVLEYLRSYVRLRVAALGAIRRLTAVDKQGTDRAKEGRREILDMVAVEYHRHAAEGTLKTKGPLMGVLAFM